jgi:transcriptional regulator with XRE-family HTH domain
MISIKEKELRANDSHDAQSHLRTLGQRLREARLDRNETQRDFAARLGVSIPTLRKMELGDPTVSIGLWAEALWVLGRQGDLDQLLSPEESLFDRYEKSARKHQRKRASTRRKKP